MHESLDASLLHPKLLRSEQLRIILQGLLNGAIFLLSSNSIVAADASIGSETTKGNLSQVRKLVAADASLLESPDSSGLTPLQIAARDGRVEIVEWLIGKGAPINARVPAGGNTPLHIAALNGKSSVVKLLLVKGADWNLKNAEEQTALAVALRERQCAVIKPLWIAAVEGMKLQSPPTVGDGSPARPQLYPPEAKKATSGPFRSGGLTADAEDFLSKHPGVSRGIDPPIAEPRSVMTLKKGQAVIRFETSPVIENTLGGVGWTGIVEETVGRSGFKLTATDHYVLRADGTKWVEIKLQMWKPTVDVRPGGCAEVRWTWEKAQRWAGSKFHCIWVGKDDTGAEIKFVQELSIP